MTEQQTQARTVQQTPDWAELYARHKNAMTNVAKAALTPAGHGHLAEDAVHNAVVSVMARAQPPPMRNPEAFLVRATQRRATDLLRSPEIARRADYPLDDGGRGGAEKRNQVPEYAKPVRNAAGPDTTGDSALSRGGGMWNATPESQGFNIDDEVAERLDRNRDATRAIAAIALYPKCNAK